MEGADFLDADAEKPAGAKRGADVESQPICKKQKQSPAGEGHDVEDSQAGRAAEGERDRVQNQEAKIKNENEDRNEDQNEEQNEDNNQGHDEDEEQDQDVDENQEEEHDDDAGGLDLLEGWVLRVSIRQSGRYPGRRDRYWHTPVRRYKLRSTKEVQRFLAALGSGESGGKNEDRDMAVVREEQKRRSNKEQD